MQTASMFAHVGQFLAILATGCFPVSHSLPACLKYIHTEKAVDSNCGFWLGQVVWDDVWGDEEAFFVRWLEYQGALTGEEGQDEDDVRSKLTQNFCYE